MELPDWKAQCNVHCSVQLVKNVRMTFLCAHGFVFLRCQAMHLAPLSLWTALQRIHQAGSGVAGQLNLDERLPWKRDNWGFIGAVGRTYNGSNLLREPRE